MKEKQVRSCSDIENLVPEQSGERKSGHGERQRGNKTQKLKDEDAFGDHKL